LADEELDLDFQMLVAVERMSTGANAHNLRDSPMRTSWPAPTTDRWKPKRTESACNASFSRLRRTEPLS